MYILFYFVLQLLHAFQNFHRFQRIQQITDLFIYYCNSSNETIFYWKSNFFLLKSFCSLLFCFPGDSMLYHDGMFFTTYDNDNDNASGNCGSVYRGAWWYNRCHNSNLNGEYGNTNRGEGINWESWRGVYYSMKEVRMMVRKL